MWSFRMERFFFPAPSYSLHIHTHKPTHFLNEKCSSGNEFFLSLSLSGCVRIRVGEYAPLGGGSDKGGNMP